MPVRLSTRSVDFTGRFNAFLAVKREAAADIETAARAIVDDVAARGDAALLEATRKFDRLQLAAGALRITPAEIEAAVTACDADTLDALRFARDRIELFHRRQLPKDDRFTDALGVELGWRWSAIDAVGLYVPGGTAAYPSSVLMFSHGGALRLDVECLECELADLGPDDPGTSDLGEGAESSGLDA